MSKMILGLDLGTNSIGWALIQQNFESKEGKILGMGSRIIPMSQDILGKFESGISISQTAERTGFRSVRRLLERDLLRRERLHRVLKVLDFLPEHYKNEIDFEYRLGQFKKGKEPKLAYKKSGDRKFEFLFKNSFEEMVADFRINQPKLFYQKKNGEETKIPYDWAIYYLRKKSLSQKIEKEELAWLLLNFNQKRGYYQLRGEEEDIEEGKEKTFEILKVGKVEDSGEKIKGKDITLYDVYFENGWKYDKQIAKPEDWIEKTKEFIVTTSQLASGEIKRSFKAVNSEEDWIAIKQKTEKDISVSDKTVGEYIYDTLLQKPNQKIRGKLIRTIERKFYKDELKRILEKQKEFHPELNDRQLYQACTEELYPFNDAHRNSIAGRDFTYLFMDDIIFYQRPLKSKKSLISDCALESRSYKTDTGEYKKQPLKAIAASNPLYQEFRLLQFLKNLRIFKKEDKGDEDITTQLLPDMESREKLYEWLNDKTDIDQKSLLKYPDFKLEAAIKVQLGTEAYKLFKKDKEQGLHTHYRWNYVEDKTYPLNETRGEILKRLKKAGIDSDFLDANAESHLWHILYSVEDRNEVESALRKYAEKHQLPETFVEVFKKFPRIEKDYGAYSEKAIKRLLPLMRFGKYWKEEDIDAATKKRIEKILSAEYDENIKDRVRDKAIHLTEINSFQDLPLWLAGYIVYDRHSEASDIQSWKTADKIELLKQHSLRNPIVEQIINETLQTVKEIWNHFGNGEEGFFDEIHVELGREMKNPADMRKQMSQKMNDNENTNLRIKALLMEMLNDGDIENVRPYSLMQQEILKIYEEGIFDNENNERELEEISKIRKKAQPTNAELKRYKLWLEQGYKSPYTGQMIPLNKLFTPAYEIEHIIPQSRFFDDSLSNKIICEAEINSLKDNQLGLEFIKRNKGLKFEMSKGKFVELLTPEAYEGNVKKYFFKNKGKMKKLLLEEIPESFIERQMNDSRYISKVVKGLLSNIVREENEQEAIAKNVVVSNGTITARLRQDWGLNDIWNDLITPRFQRLNQITKSEHFGRINPNTNKFLPEVPIEYAKGFNKKRIDHRHHALDALVVACSTRNHINYLNNDNANGKDKNKPLRFDLRNKLRHVEKIEIEKTENGQKIRKKIKVAKDFIKPWEHFTKDAKDRLSQIIVSFKKNNRVINKTTNYYQRWEKQDDGSMKKVIAKQKKGDAWAIRKPLHKDTVSGDVKIPGIKVPKDKRLSATRKALDTTFDQKRIASITDSGIQKILLNYLAFKGNDPELAFSPEGIDELNQNIAQFNNNVPHQPIFKVRVYELGSKFNLGERGNKPTKFVEAAKGTNLFFAVYADNNGNRNYETIPLNEVIEHQKWKATLPKEKQKQTPDIPVNSAKGTLLFSLSPNDLVYVPTEDELESSNLFNLNQLSHEQVQRVYKFVSCTGSEGHFVPNMNATEIVKNENGTNSKNERLQDFFNGKVIMDKANKPVMIKSICWKLETDRLGNIKKVIGRNASVINALSPDSLNEPETPYQTKKIKAFQSFDDLSESDAQQMASLTPQDHLKNITELQKTVFRDDLETPMDKKIKFKD